MNATHSDAFVFFGATGELAFKKTFPSLQAMAKRGQRRRPGAAGDDACPPVGRRGAWPPLQRAGARGAPDYRLYAARDTALPGVAVPLEAAHILWRG